MLSMKKLALLSMTGVTAVGLAVGGATYAIFTSSAQNTNNNFTTGTLILKADRDSGDTIPGPMFYSSTKPTADGTTIKKGDYPYDVSVPPNIAGLGGEAIGGWAPGDTVTRAMNLKNDGTIDAKVTKLRAHMNSATSVSSTDAGYQDFIKGMTVTVTYNTGTKPVLYTGSLENLINNWQTINPVLPLAAQGAPANIQFEAHLDKQVGNSIMGKDFVFDFEFYAEQAKNN